MQNDEVVFASEKKSRFFIYAILLLACLFYLFPLYVMLATSFKSLDEIRLGNMLSIPNDFIFSSWINAWESSCIGVVCNGLKGYFINSIKMVIPAVTISTILGALNGFVLTKWQFRGHHLVFGLMLFGCFIPFQAILIPTALFLGKINLNEGIQGLVLVHIAYGIGFTTLFFRNYYITFPTEILNAAKIEGAGFFTIFFKIFLPSSVPIIMVSVIWQFTNIWNDFLFGVSFTGSENSPVTVALNNLVNSTTSGKEYNVDMAAAIIAAFPTLIIYILAGKYFVRGLLAGSVKK